MIILKAVNNRSVTLAHRSIVGSRHAKAKMKKIRKEPKDTSQYIQNLGRTD